MAGDRERTLLDLDPRETEAAVVERGGRAFHARVAREKVLGEGALDYDGMTSLPARLRERLTEELPVVRGVELRRSRASDGTRKLLIELPTPSGRPASVEAVHIPSRRPDRHATLCISTQAGCPVGCPFCASGKLGLTRNLTSGEILEQLVRGRALGPLSRVVVMGVGEPLLNLENVRRALATVREEMGIGARKITVSTVGFPDRLDRLARDDPHFQLAISLHSPDDEQRARLVPAMADVPVEEVLAAGDRWFEATGREITYEYVLLGGENDTPGHARRLANRLQNRRATVNLIPYNPIAEEDWPRPTPETVEAFRATLERKNVVATVRWSRGLEADAACGQLRLRTAASPT